MDVSESGAIKSNGNSNSDPGKKKKRKRKNRSAKQIERARKYRERNYHHIDARDTIMPDPTHPAICHTKSEFGQHLYRQPINQPLQFGGLFLPGATESHPPAYFLCQGILPNLPWNMSNIGTIIQKPVSNSEEFVPNSTKKSNIETIVQDQVSNLRATAKVFVPASPRKVEITFESHEDKNIEKVEDIILEIDKTRNGIKLDIDETNKLLKTIDTPKQHLTAVNIDNKVPESNYKRKDKNATTYDDNMLSDSNTEERIITGSSNTNHGDSIQEELVFPENSTPEDDRSDTDNSDNILEESVIPENSTQEGDERDTHNSDNILEESVFHENSTPEDDKNDTDNGDNILEESVYHENSTPEDDKNDTDNGDNILEESVISENSTPEDDESDTNNCDNILEESVFHENNTPEDDESDMFSILQVFTSSSLHCALYMSANSASTCTDDNDFGYAYFDMSNLLK